MDEKRILEYLERGMLLSPDAGDDVPQAGGNTLVADAADAVGVPGIDPIALDEAKVREQKHNDARQAERLRELASSGELDEKPVRIVFSYTKASKKRTYDDFVAFYNHRYRAISGMLRLRQELQGAIAIKRVQPRGRDKVAVIAMIAEKSVTKNGNYMLTLEDPSGELKAIISPKSPSFAQARDLVLDEVVGVTGVAGDGIFFVENVLVPDVPITHELKKGPVEEYMALIGDPQVGSKYFLAKDFQKMLHWLNGKLGNDEQRRIAALVKYLIIPGDLVDGVGVYPGQEADLTITDIKAQYVEFARLLRQVPERISIIVTPGNHDAGRLSEPQPPIYKDFAPELYALRNVTVVSNPAIITIGAQPGFSGFEVLIYHGYSLIYYSDNVPSIRERGGQKCSELIMKFLLQRRHLAPTHNSNLFIPDAEQDPLVLTRVPDIFVTGHIHRVASATYRGVTLVNASAWVDVSDEQERRGLEPQPARVPVINLQTRDVRVINFYSGRGKGLAEDEHAPVS